jgi:hypothetical protein
MFTPQRRDQVERRDKMRSQKRKKKKEKGKTWDFKPIGRTDDLKRKRGQSSNDCKARRKSGSKAIEDFLLSFSKPFCDCVRKITWKENTHLTPL